MKWKDTKTIALLTVLYVTASFTNIQAAGPVEWNVFKTLNLETTPIDMSISADGTRLFVLTEDGNVHIYSSATGTLTDKIDVGKQIDQITAGPRGDFLVLRNRKDKTVQVITLEFIQNIDVSGSPFKGAEDAAVVVAVFSDFE